MRQERQARFAGSWYPRDLKSLDALWSNAETQFRPGRSPGGSPDSAVISRRARPPSAVGRLCGGALPHAGLSYSQHGQFALYRRLQHMDPAAKHFILLAPSHYTYLSGSSLTAGEYKSYDARYRSISASGDPENFRDLGIEIDTAALDLEHALELLLPGLGRFADVDISLDCFLTPTIQNKHQIEVLADQVEALMDRLHPGEEVFLLASSDFTHYGQRFNYHRYGRFSDEEARRRVREDDLGIAGLLCSGSWDEVVSVFSRPGAPTICGITGLTVQSCLAARRGWAGEVLGYYNSAELSGRYDGSPDAVAYCTLAYYAPDGDNAGSVREADEGSFDHE